MINRTTPTARAMVLYMVIFMALAVVLTTAVQAQPRHYYPHRISVGQANNIAVSSYPGTVVGRTRLVNLNGRLVYEVSVRPNPVYGRPVPGIRRVYVDAYSGGIVGLQARPGRGPHRYGAPHGGRYY